MSSNLPLRVKRAFRLAIRRSSSTAQDVDEEIRFHLEARAERLEREGLSPERARAEASRRFGSLATARARLRRSASQRDHRLRFRELAGNVRQDARIAWRGLRRSPGFLVLAALCLSLGIGANAAIYSVIDAVLLRPLSFSDPSRLVRVWTEGAVPPGVYELLGASSSRFTGLAGFGERHKVSALGSGAPVRYTAAEVSANLFDVLGVRPELGRTFVPGENAPGKSNVVVLSDGVWRDHYAADHRVIGTSMVIDGVARTIIGVMPAEFRFPSVDVQLWTPESFVPSAPSYWWGAPLRLVARLRRDASISQARSEQAIALSRARGAFPMRMPDDWGTNVDVVPLRDSMVGAARPTLLLLFAAVGLVLLIACVNVATLYVDRATTREREIAIRTALGASRARIIAQLLTESLIVAAIGAAAGLSIASAGVRVLVAMLPAGTPRADEIEVDGHVLAFTLVLAALSGLAFGLLPALRAARLDVQSSLRRDGRSGISPNHASATRLLAIGQVALAVVVVTAAGLLIKSFWQLRHVGLGFDTTHVLATEVPIPSFDHDTATRATAFYEAIVARARGIPGVHVAAAASALPFGAIAYPAAMEIESRPTPPGGIPAQPIRTTVTPDYFRTLAIPLIRGRDFTSADRAGTPLVAIIDSAAAREYWPNRDALGQRLRYVWNQNWITVVGVVGDVKRDSLSGIARPSLYLPLGQGFAEEMLIVGRASSTASVPQISAALRTAITEVDPTVPASDVHALEGFVAESAARVRFTATLLAIFASVALLLGATGIYGVMTSAVSRRTREIGVRMALGATSHGVLRMVLQESASVTVIGMMLGIAGAIAGAGLLRGLLFGVATIDVSVLGAVAALLAAIAVIAAAVPARRASHVDPLAAMRTD